MQLSDFFSATIVNISIPSPLFWFLSAILLANINPELYILLTFMSSCADDCWFCCLESYAKIHQLYLPSACFVAMHWVVDVFCCMVGMVGVIDCINAMYENFFRSIAESVSSNRYLSVAAGNNERAACSRNTVQSNALAHRIFPMLYKQFHRYQSCVLGNHSYLPASLHEACWSSDHIRQVSHIPELLL